MDTSLTYATTPLALASLAIIAGIGILKLLVAGKDNALNRLITHYGFMVVIAFGILGNASYLYTMSLSSETLILGDVVDANTGASLPKAIIDAGGRARGMTGDDGNFALAIPKSRTADAYSLTVQLPGYEKAVTTVKDQSRIFVRFELKEKRRSAADVLKFGQIDFVIGHYFGVPEIYLPLRIDNQGTTPIALSNFSLTLKAPSGAVRQLVLTSSAPSPMGPMGAPLVQAQVKAQDQLSWIDLFIQYDNQVQSLYTRAMKALQDAPGYRQAGPQTGAEYLPETLNRELQQALADNWFWEPGNTTITLACVDADGQRYEISGKVALTAAQVASMKRSSDYYRAGYGIVSGFELTPVGSAQPGQRVTFEKS